MCAGQVLTLAEPYELSGLPATNLELDRRGSEEGMFADVWCSNRDDRRWARSTTRTNTLSCRHVFVNGYR